MDPEIGAHMGIGLFDAVVIGLLLMWLLFIIRKAKNKAVLGIVWGLVAAISLYSILISSINNW